MTSYLHTNPDTSYGTPPVLDPTTYIGVMTPTANASTVLVKTFTPGSELVGNTTQTKDSVYNGLTSLWLGGAKLSVFVPGLSGLTTKRATVSLLQVLTGDASAASVTDATMCGSRWLTNCMNQWFNVPCMFSEWDNTSLTNESLKLKVVVTLPAGVTVVAPFECFLSV